jgi:hypothetical protein
MSYKYDILVPEPEPVAVLRVHVVYASPYASSCHIHYIVYVPEMVGNINAMVACAVRPEYNNV